LAEAEAKNEMLERMDECARRLSAEDVRAIEAQAGIRLPDEYKTFLLRYNGGRPRPSAFPIQGLVNNPFGVIQVFFGIDDPVESCNLDWNIKTLGRRLPANLFPIACDDGGDIVCLSLSGDDVGSVLFWDCYDEPDEPSYVNVYRIAESFPAFLAGLQPLPEVPVV
jgi:hypothetical protein